MVKIKPTKLGYRLLSLLLTLSMLLSITCITAFADEGETVDVDSIKSELTSNKYVGLDEVFSGGSGSSTDPFQISTESDLIKLQLVSNGEANDDLVADLANGVGKYFEITADIALTAAWTPIANGEDYAFSGTFYGNSYTISGLSLTEEIRAGEDVSAYGGMFGYIDNATIMNLTVCGSIELSIAAGDDSTGSTAAYAGAVAAYAVDSTLAGCTGAASISITNADSGSVMMVAGGVVGHFGASVTADDDGNYEAGTAAISGSAAASAAKISVATSVNGDSIGAVAGGVVGLAEGATVSSCESAATVTVQGSETEYNTTSYKYHDDSALNQAGDATIYHDLNEYYYSNAAGGVVGAAVGLYSVETKSGTGGGGMSGGSAVASVVKKCVIENCTATAVVTNNTGSSLSFAGGIMGTALFASVSDSTFGGSADGTYAGGIVAMAAGNDSIAGCTLSSTASVTATSTGGGIVAQLGGQTDSGHSGSNHAASTVTGCTTESGATVGSAESTIYAGGIAGYVTYADSIADDVNNAAVNATTRAGGIVAYTYGEARASSGGAGGGNSSTVGYSAAVTVENCTNAGAITVPVADSFSTGTSAYKNASAGGIIGYTQGMGDIESCTNSGTVTGTNAGGIVGAMFSSEYIAIATSILNAVNNGNVNASGYAGGIIGVWYGTDTISSVGDSSLVTIAGCLNSGNIGGSENSSDYTGGYLGGIAGYLRCSTIYNCANTGSVGADTVKNNVGGIVAAILYTTIINSYNSGSIYVTNGTTSAPTNIAGLAALLSTSGEIYNCYNAGTVSGTAKTSVSAVVGNTVATSVIQDCYALTGTQDNLTAGTKGTINAYWFDTSMNLTDSTYSTLLLALNTYVNENTDYELSHWWTVDESYAYPVFSEDVPQTDAPEAPTFTVDGATSTGVTLNLTESVEVTAVNTTEDVYYQWYTASDASGSDMTAISGATGAKYTITDTAAVGTTYYFAAARVLGDYSYSEWTFSQPFTVTVEFATDTDGSITYGDVTIELDSSEAVNSADNPYIIDTVDKLKALSSLLTAGTSLEGMYFEQTANIDASAETDWTPIGTSAMPFDGNYAGGNYTVTLAIDSSEDEQALFGYNSGTIADLTVAGSVTTSGAGAAGIVFVNTGVVNNCVNTASVSAAGENSSYNNYQTGSVGGVAAYVLNGTVSNSQNSGSISYTAESGKYNNVGGVVGAAQGSAITNCVNSGNVAGAALRIGGVVGYLITFTSTGYTAYVSNSGNTGAVSGGSYAGGIVGNVSSYSLVVNSYNTGSVAGSSYAGGIAGSITGTAYNCYNAGAISGESYIGGLTGGNGGEIASAYYLAQDSLAAIGSGSGSASGIGSFNTDGSLTAEEDDTLNYSSSLFNSLQGWAIDNRNNYELLGWAAQDDGYPVLDNNVDLDEISAPYAAVELNADSSVERGATAELSATVSFDNTADAISVAYTWYKDGVTVATGDITSDFAESTSTVIKTTVDTDYPGVYTYTLRITNTNDYTASVTEESMEITVVKLESDTSWYGDTDIAEAFAGGEGTETSPYLISDANELAYLAQLVNAGEATDGAYYEVTCNLDLNGYTWTSIGTTENLFAGNFNGGGYTISGLQDNSLFGYTADAAITDLVIDGSITGRSNVAALVNQSISGTLELSNIGNNASITATASGTTNAGGLIGRVNSGTTVIISGCYNAGTITSTYADIGVSSIGGGGLVGQSNGTLEITDSYNIGDIASAGNQYVGGLVAFVDSLSTFSLSNSYNAGKLTGSGVVYALAGTANTYDCTSVNCYYIDNADSPYTDYTGASAVAAVTASMLGSAFTDVGSAATFDFSHATVSINGTAVESGAAVAATYPALTWESNPQRDAASVTFTVTADDDYGVYSVNVGDTEMTANDDGSYTVTVDEDVTVTVNVKRVSWSGDDDAANDINSIIASDAAGTESKDDEDSTYDSSLDLNDDGKNDLLDILDILYTESAQSEDSSSESTDSEDIAAEATDEAETDSSAAATESAEG